ncbi:MAG: DUF6920 family protein [Bryobacteraceae bacterium]
MKLPWIAAGLVLAAVVVTAAAGRLRWESSTRTIRARLAGAMRTAAGSQHPANLPSLPLPVQRYLRRAVPRTPRPVTAVRIRQEGLFNLSESGERWVPFTATQLVTLDPPGFDWDARVRYAPGVAVYVRDGYVGGEGLTEARLFALWPLASVRGHGNVAVGQRLRFLAESPWYPALLLPGSGVRWETVDDRHARAILKDDRTETSLLFTFGEDDFVLAVRAEARPRSTGGSAIPTPWQGRFGSYVERQGFWIPREGEASWLLPSGPHPYWRGRISSIEFGFAR